MAERAAEHRIVQRIGHLLLLVRRILNVDGEIMTKHEILLDC